MKHITSREELLAYLQEDPSGVSPRRASASETTTASSEHDHIKHVGAYLEALTTFISERLSNRDWDHPVFEQHIVPYMKAFMDHREIPLMTSRQQYIEGFKEVSRENPNYKVETVNVSATVDEEHGTASVWMLLHIFNHPEGTRREGVPIFDWKLIAGKWMLTSMNGIRGPGGFPT